MVNNNFYNLYNINIQPFKRSPKLQYLTDKKQAIKTKDAQSQNYQGAWILEH